ncbi:MAG: glutamate--tRNA ligase [Alphaproteobacteria bacterium]|nr:glutamate--tRNA ligase [Alphaproteobacteria bacterium]
MTVVTRFAPSPTGYLHIGGARTALFNWLYAKHHNGTFLLRIEDTDRERSTQGAIDAILDGMEWLGLKWDGEVVYQFSRAARHAEVAHRMLEEGKAYYCYCSPEELEEMRAKATHEKTPFRYDRRWRDRSASEAPAGVKPVVRLKAPLEGETVIDDRVQGRVVVGNKELDDLVLLRSDGTPTYMLSVVVDDHDMGVTHIIRGDDHLTNAARQSVIYDAMGWEIPSFSHIPLIHGPDGAKLSKRHGALGVEAYREMGYLPEALRNYLLRLGWSHGDDEIISTEQAIEWFNLESVGRSPSRFDFAKLENLNGHYIREAKNEHLVEVVVPEMEKQVGHPLSRLAYLRLEKGMGGLKQRAKTVKELVDSALFYVLDRPLPFNDKAEKILQEGGKDIIRGVFPLLEGVTDWKSEKIEDAVRIFAEGKALKLGNVAQPLRAALTGSNISPGVFEIMEILEKDESLARLKDAA